MNAEPFKMTLPGLASRVEQSHDSAGQWIAAAEVWTLVEIAAVATPATVIRIIGSAVLPGDDVLCMELGQRRAATWQVAVLAALPGSCADQLAKRSLHLS